MRRALHDWQKEQRSVAILEAAEALFVKRFGELPRVDDVARKAKIAKGTVYLYFSSKEAIFLSLLEWRLSEWIEDALAQINENAASLSIDDIIDAFLTYPLENRIVLDLASFSSALLETSVDEQVALEYKITLSNKLEKIGAAIGESDIDIASDEILLRLLRSYAYVVGLWQLVEPRWVKKSLRKRKQIRWLQIDFETDVRAALAALWKDAV